MVFEGRRHSGDAVESGAAEHVAQHRLGLIVQRVTRGAGRREGTQTTGARSRFQIRAVIDVDVVEDEGDVELTGDLFRSRRFAGRLGAEVVVDVVGDDTAPGGDSKHEESSRVGAAGEGAVECRAGRRKAAALPEDGDEVV